MQTVVHKIKSSLLSLQDIACNADMLVSLHVTSEGRNFKSNKKKRSQSSEGSIIGLVILPACELQGEVVSVYIVRDVLLKVGT